MYKRQPEGYRKALRLMQMAERFNLPIITFIDTPGAYPVSYTHLDVYKRQVLSFASFAT